VIALWLGAAWAADPPADPEPAAPDDGTEPADPEPEPDGSWLDAARPPDPEPAAPAAPASAPTRGELGTFGIQLDVLGLDVSWSGYGDAQFEWKPTEREMTFEVGHFNPIIGARLSDDLWAELEFEVEESGTEIGVEYAILDYAPISAFGLRIGKFLLPIGDYNEVLHPSFRWVQVTRPTMFDDVVPSEWAETGVQVRGLVPTGTVGGLRYAAWVANGLAADPFDPAAPEPLRSARDNYEDLNYDLAWGGQLVYTALPGMVGQTSVSVGTYTGAIDVDATTRVSVADVALASQLGPVSLHAEAARNFVNPMSGALEAFEDGFYGQLALRVGKVTPSVRYDLSRSGRADPAPSEVQQVAGTVLLQAATFWSVRAEGAAVFRGTDDPEPAVYLMSAFHF
jgi:hypothetical protein